MGITIGAGPPPPTPEQPTLLRGAARENLDITLHGKKLLTDGAGSPDVLINDEGAWRERISEHKCDAHASEYVLAGVQQIYINDVRAVRVHDYLVAGSGIMDPIVTGSPDVFMGDDDFGLTSKDEFCKKFNELMSKWPTMTPAERKDGLNKMVEGVATSKGMPAPNMNKNTASYASFNPGTWEMIIPQNYLDLYAGKTGSTDIFSEPTLSSDEQCKFGKTIVHELRHQTMAFNALRKISENPGVTSGLKYWPYSKANLPPGVMDAAKNQPLTAGSPEDASAVNAIYDYYGDNGIAAADYVHTAGGADAARHQWKVGCCTENR